MPEAGAEDGVILPRVPERPRRLIQIPSGTLSGRVEV